MSVPAAATLVGRALERTLEIKPGWVLKHPQGLSIEIFGDHSSSSNTSKVSRSRQ